MMQLALANLECTMVDLVAAPQLLSIMALQPMGRNLRRSENPNPSPLISEWRFCVSFALSDVHLFVGQTNR